MKILITGDRSIHPVLAVEAVAGTINAVAERIPGLDASDFVTGDLETGVERAVRYLLPGCTIFPYPQVDEHADFPAAYEALAKNVSLAVVIHPDPLASHIASAVTQAFPAERVWLPMQYPATF